MKILTKTHFFNLILNLRRIFSLIAVPLRLFLRGS